MTLQPRCVILYVKHKLKLQSPRSHKNSNMMSNIDIWSLTLAKKLCSTPEIFHCYTESTSLHLDGWVPSMLVLTGKPTRICWAVSLLGWRAFTLSSMHHSSSLATCLMSPLHMTSQSESLHPEGRMSQDKRGCFGRV